MPHEQVVDLFCAHRQVFAVELLEEGVVILKSHEPVVCLVNASVRVSDVDLRQLVLPVHFKLVFYLEQIFKKLAYLHMRLETDASFRSLSG